jgi:hypothetical protein
MEKSTSLLATTMIIASSAVAALAGATLSVPTLTELLKPAAERVSSFKVGVAYDPAAVGLAREQTQFSTTLMTTDCSDRGSGNSRCSHEYGTTLSETEKKALLEYLKSL